VDFANTIRFLMPFYSVSSISQFYLSISVWLCVDILN